MSKSEERPTESLEFGTTTSSLPKSDARRKIPGNLPYTTSPGPLARVLDKLPISEKPGVFNVDFLSTVLGVSGGASRPIIPILKACGMLSPTGAPTEVYAQFQTESGRGAAALDALKSGFPEIFKRNQYAHKADELVLKDIVVSITGLPKTDQITRSICNTFIAFQRFTKTLPDASPPQIQSEIRANDKGLEYNRVTEKSSGGVGLIYNINIVLPETTNIEVYNVIFKSLRGNLLQ